VSVEWVEGAGSRANLRLKAIREGVVVGECHCDSCGEYSRVDEAQDAIYTTWLGVDEEYAGKGLGTALLRQALVEARSVGYQRAVISTNQYNYRARVLYSNFGYRTSDWTYCQRRELDPAPPEASRQ
jgi:GNAT superfamily N-acetyltransferase